MYATASGLDGCEPGALNLAELRNWYCKSAVGINSQPDSTRFNENMTADVTIYARKSHCGDEVGILVQSLYHLGRMV
jgi:hypothetical protein